jgi:D-mannonate dehydratase
LKERNIIGTQNPQPIQENDEQIQESLNNVFKNMSVLPNDDDEDVLASVKSMLKIAQKLDIKKEYRLADKLTYILRKKI